MSAKQLLHHHEQSHRRYRALFNGVYVGDSIAAHLVWEDFMFPYAYFPASDVQSKYLKEGGAPVAETATAFAKSKPMTLTVGNQSTDKVSIVEEGDLKGYVRFDWDAMDAWFEEDTEIRTHPKDPYKRLDALLSTRHVVHKFNGVTIAETHNPTLVFETLLPTRYYMPKTAVKWEFAKKSDTITTCPYKGEANYYSMDVNGQTIKDLIWWHKYPAGEANPITGLVCFDNDKVETWVNGVKEKTPVA